VELTRLALRHDKLSERALANAVAALALEEKPDPAELESILARATSPTAFGPATVSDDFDRFTYTATASRISLAMLRGEYDAAEKLLAQPRPQSEVPEYVHHAVAFLKTHHSTLIGDREPWRRTVAVYPLKAGGCLLLTRDLRMGYAGPDAKLIRQVPPPVERWEPLSHPAMILNAQGERGIVSTSNETVFVLNDHRTRWEPLVRLPEYHSWWRLETLSPAFDNLIPILHSRGDKPARIVEPEILWSTGQRLVSLMLSDGTWLSCDTRAGTVWQPRQIAGQLLGEQIEIYAVLSPACDDLRAFLCTDHGLLDWRPAQGTVARLDLPKVDDVQPVTSTREGAIPPEGTVRIALFPKAGGTTFLVNTATGDVRLEGCVNESYPLTYWRQKTPQWKRDTLTKALGEANLQYPWTTRPAD
jgi:hypothetical protein